MEVIYADTSVFRGIFDKEFSEGSFIASWNFKHMANTKKNDLINEINAKCGFRTITIQTPDQIIKP